MYIYSICYRQQINFICIYNGYTEWNTAIHIYTDYLLRILLGLVHFRIGICSLRTGGHLLTRSRGLFKLVDGRVPVFVLRKGKRNNERR